MIFIGTSTKSENRFKTIHEDFIKVHGNFYDYSKAKYKTFKTNIDINCLIHGNFKTTPKRHIEGIGCPICKDIEQINHIRISEKNLKTHRMLVIDYLSETYPNFDFSNFELHKGVYTFMCKIHGEIKSKHLVCEKCKLINAENKKNATINNRLTIFFKNVPNMKLHSLNSLNSLTDEIILECEHGKHSYTKQEIYNNVNKCKKCRDLEPCKNLISQDEFIKRAIKRVGDIFHIKETTYINAQTPIQLTCDIHGKFEILTSNFLKGQGCPKCSNVVSKPELEISEIFPGAILSDRDLIKPYEIDLLYEKFGIEYNGLLWHSSGKSEHSLLNKNEKPNYHLMKTNLCEEKGIQLYHIFENEWINDSKKEIWKSVINSKLNNTERIFARKTSIRLVKTKESNEFLEKNHLQGKCNASIKIGLFYKEELVSLMTFGKSRYNKSVQYELIRFCSKLNTTVVGGASKLLKAFERMYNPESIISYANRRWSQGNLYEKLNFEFIENTNPNYFYFKLNENILYSRVQFQKHKLKDKLEIFDPGLTETENMYNNNYRKIYDSGNKKYIKKYK